MIILLITWIRIPRTLQQKPYNPETYSLHLPVDISALTRDIDLSSQPALQL